MSFYSKIYANTVAKYNEGRILQPEQLKRLTSVSFADALQLLTDYGYGEGVPYGEKDIDTYITAETFRLIEFVDELCPGDELKACLLNKFMYSDAKVIYKSRYAKTESKTALYGAFPALENAITSLDYTTLPIFMSDALKSLDDRFAQSEVSPRKIDVALTRAMYADNIYNAKKSKNRLLNKYVCAEIDFANIQTAFRCKRLMLKTDDFYQEFITGGTLKVAIFDEAIETNFDPQCTLFSNALYGEVSQKLSQSFDFIAFENESSKILHSILAQDNVKMTTLGPFLNYFLEKIEEFKTVKTILVCVKNNAIDEIKKRYGVANE